MAARRLIPTADRPRLPGAGRHRLRRWQRWRSPSGRSDGQVMLRMSTWGNDSRLKLTTEGGHRVRAGQSQHQDPGGEQRVGVAIGRSWPPTTAGNSSPDVIQMDESYIGAYGGRGALLDLGKQSSVLDLSAMDAKVLDTGKVEGNLVGAPIGIANFSVGINPDLLKQAGLKMPDDKTWTWDDFATMASTVTQKLGSKGVTGMDFFGANAAEIGAWTRQHDQEVFPTEGQAAVTPETLQSFFEFGKRLQDSKATPVASAQVEDSTAPLDASQFATNKAAFHLLFHTQIAAYVAASGIGTEAAATACAGSGGSPHMVNKASMYWSISSRSEHPAEAAKLVNFMMTDPAAVKILKVERGIPAIPAVQSEIEPLLDPTGKMSLAFAQEMQAEVVPPPQVTPQNASGFGRGDAHRHRRVFGRKTPADAAKEVQTVIESSR